MHLAGLITVLLTQACLDHDLVRDGCAPPELTHGPIVGGTSDTTARIWARSAGRAQLAVEYWAQARPDEVFTSTSATLARAGDFSGVVTIAGLEPLTRYGYRVLLTPDSCPEEAAAVTAAEATFRTLPAVGAPSSVRFIVAADVGGPDVPAFQQMHELGPDFVLMTGDNVYAGGGDRTLEAYRAEYRRVWGGTQFRELFSHVPVFMIWDDHEIVNDYWRGKNDDVYAVARQAYDEYQGSHNPDPVHAGELYYTFAAGQTEVFVLDARTHRSRNNDPDAAGKTMLGSEQKAALEAWAVSSQALVKVIVSSVSFSDFGMTRNDSWKGFRSEREELFAFFSENDVGPVVLITGDQHWSAVFRYEVASEQGTPYVLYEFMPTPLAFEVGSASTESSVEILARDDDHLVFGVVDIDTSVDVPRIDFTLCAVDETCEPHEHATPATAFDGEGEEETVPFTVRLSAHDFVYGQ